MTSPARYRFVVDMDHGFAATSADPDFAVSFGGRSKLRYRDAVNQVTVGASYEGIGVSVVVEDLQAKLASAPAGESDEDYLETVTGRIAAAAAWQGLQLEFIHRRE